MKKIALFLICLIGLASAQVQIPLQFKWRKSTESDWNKHRLVFIQGANITLTVTGDTSLTIAGTGGGGADTLTYWAVNTDAYTVGHRLRLLAGSGITIANTGDTSATVTSTLGTSISGGEIDANAVDSTKIADNTISETDLHISNGTTDGQFLKWTDASGMTWAAGAGGSDGDTLVDWRLDAGAYAGGKRLHFITGTGATLTKTGDTSLTIATILGTDIAWGELQSAVQESMHVWAANLRNTAQGADTVKFGNDTLKVATADTAVWLVPTVSTERIYLGRIGKWDGDSGVTQAYQDFKNLGGFGNPASGYLRIYAKGDSVWAKTSAGDSISLSRAGGGAGSDTLTIFNVDGGAFNTGERIQFLSGAGITITKANAESLTFAITDNGVTGAKIALTSQATGDIMYYDGTDWVVQGTHLANTVLHGNGAAAPTFSAIVGGDIGANEVDGTKIAIASQASGDIMYYDGTDWVRLAAGGANTVLHGTTPPAYSAIVSGDVTAQTLDSTDLGNNSVSVNEIADRKINRWLYPQTYGADTWFVTRELNADSNKTLGCSFRPFLYKDSMNWTWLSEDSTDKIINLLIGYNLTNFTSWDSLKFLNRVQGTNDTVRVFLYRNSWQATDSTWGTATDSTGALVNTSWALTNLIPAAGSWTDGDIAFIRIRFRLHGTAGTAWAKLGKIYFSYNAKS